jgi:hypothetical protein
MADRGVPDTLGVAALAATAAAAPQLLEDPAHQLLSPVPHNRRRRVGHRAILFLPVLVGVWVLVAPLVIDRPRPASVSIGPLLALAAIGLAAGGVTGRVLPDLGAPVGTTIPLGAVALWLLLADHVKQVGMLDIWIDHPWVTAPIATLICLASLRETGLSGPQATRPTS